jgi:hypothetical protein
VATAAAPSARRAQRKAQPRPIRLRRQASERRSFSSIGDDDSGQVEYLSRICRARRPDIEERARADLAWRAARHERCFEPSLKLRQHERGIGKAVGASGHERVVEQRFCARDDNLNTWRSGIIGMVITKIASPGYARLQEERGIALQDAIWCRSSRCRIRRRQTCCWRACCPVRWMV